MDRADFFSFIKKSVVDTVKEVSAPFIEDDLKKVDQMVDSLAGIKWLPAYGETLNNKIGYQDLYIQNRHLASYFDGEEVTVFDKVCPKCQTIVQWISYDRKLKCFGCDTSITVIDRQGDLQLKEYETKCENGIWFIGIL
ncbi:hypothetical protein [Calidifontibacillus oryziterrae]|uniref:hypothetical protein n=1 Tax=Calidifontibacillus oryziterrae TaxID=1191699 RepID=UPI0002F7E68C|nr:hypothetical protein [Calidifontibacillus oryziterrae]